MKSVFLKTVTAPAYEDLGSLLTPRLHLVVDYTQGGKSLITGKEFQKGYQIAIRSDRVCDRGFRFMIIDGKGDPTFCVEQSERFRPKRLDSIVADVRSGKYDDLISEMYAIAKASKNYYVWPVSILPLAAVPAKT